VSGARNGDGEPSERAFDGLRASIRLALHEAGCKAFGGVAPVLYHWTLLRYMPRVRRRLPVGQPWAAYSRETPPELRTVPVWRDEEEAERAHERAPLHGFFVLHPQAARLNPYYGWAWQITSVPSRLRTRVLQEEMSAPERQPAEPARHDPHGLSEAIRAEGERLGLSAVGFAPFDEKYTLAGGLGLAHLTGPEVAKMSRGSVVVCILEQDWELTQSIPSSKCERGVMRTYAANGERAAKLTEFIHAQGIRAELHALAGPLVDIHFAVEAGLGQLGLNGQLLTPHAGSRCRIAVITTDATLEHAGPVDYGIHKICDACQVCVKRCPPGAIPNRRRDHRGVRKAKIKPERCLPTVAQAHGCAICMKVCPVQRYGLERVAGHYVETGEILGKGTDELEGFDWIDGRHYGPRSKPKLSKEFLRPLGISIDPDRTTPAAQLHESDAEDIALA
jgi:epoxyqueuosine reductase